MPGFVDGPLQLYTWTTENGCIVTQLYCYDYSAYENNQAISLLGDDYLLTTEYEGSGVEIDFVCDEDSNWQMSYEAMIFQTPHKFFNVSCIITENAPCKQFEYFLT